MGLIEPQAQVARLQHQCQTGVLAKALGLGVLLTIDV